VTEAFDLSSLTLREGGREGGTERGWEGGEGGREGGGEGGREGGKDLLLVDITNHRLCLLVTAR
jgi:hypothetical protein